jgi:hypothetical protein
MSSDPRIEAVIRHDFDNGPYRDVYGDYETWRDGNPQAFAHQADQVAALLAAADAVDPLRASGSSPEPADDYASGAWCGECRYGVLEDPPCCTKPCGKRGPRAGSSGQFTAICELAAGHEGACNGTMVRCCDVPPVGWYCTRAPGHDGPCAAHPAGPVPAGDEQ